MSSLPEIRGKTFTSQKLKLDGTNYVECTFKGCELVYEGGGQMGLNGCNFDNEHGINTFSFDGPAANTVEFLKLINKEFGEHGKQAVQQLFGGTMPVPATQPRPDQILVVFQRFIIRSQSYMNEDNNENYMISTVFYDLTVHGQTYSDLQVDVRQEPQSDYDTDPIEFSKPNKGGYKGLFPLYDFDDALIEYMRSVMGPNGTLLRYENIPKNGRGVYHANVTFTERKEAILTIPPDERSSGAWELDNLETWRTPRSRRPKVVPLRDIETTKTDSETEVSKKNLDRKNQ